MATSLDTLLPVFRRQVDDDEDPIPESFTADPYDPTNFILSKAPTSKPSATRQGAAVDTADISWTPVDPLTVVISSAQPGDAVIITYTLYAISDKKAKGYLRDAVMEMEQRWKRNYTVSDDNDGIPEKINATVDETTKLLICQIAKVLVSPDTYQSYRDEVTTYTTGNPELLREQRIDQLVNRARANWDAGFAISSLDTDEQAVS